MCAKWLVHAQGKGDFATSVPISEDQQRRQDDIQKMCSLHDSDLPISQCQLLGEVDIDTLVFLFLFLFLFGGWSPSEKGFNERNRLNGVFLSLEKLEVWGMNWYGVKYRKEQIICTKTNVWMFSLNIKECDPLTYILSITFSCVNV